MSRVQLAINVGDLDLLSPSTASLSCRRSRATPPGYALLGRLPPLKLALIHGEVGPGSPNHLGIEVDSSCEAAVPPCRRPVG